MKRKIYSSLLFSATIIALGSPVYALDDLNSGGTSSSSSRTTATTEQQAPTAEQIESQLNQPSNGSGTINLPDAATGANPLSEGLKGFKPVRSEDVAKAAQSSGWFRDMVSWGISLLVIFTWIGIGFVTALDMVFIGIPPLRGLLLRGSGGNQMGMQPGMGSTGGGGFQLISDEALEVVSGDGGMGGQGAYGNPQGVGGGNEKGKSKIARYLQMRALFLILFGVCTTLLFTSIFMDFGIKIGELFINLFTFVMDKLNNVG